MEAKEQQIDDELVVNLDEDEGTDKENKTAETKVKADAGTDVDAVDHDLSADEGIEELKAKLAAREKAEDEARQRAAEDRKRADAAEAKYRDADDQIANYKAQLFVKEFETAESMIESSAREIMAAKLAGAAAKESGDVKGEWDAQERLALAASKKNEAETYKAHLEARKDEIASELKHRHEAMEAEKKKPRKPPTAEEQFENYVSSLSGPSQRWLRDNREAAMDPVQWNIIVAADGEARKLGKDVDTNAYFNHIEARLKSWRGGEANDRDEDDAEETQTDTRRAAVAAPVSRSNANGRGRSGNSVTLNRAQREMAHSLRPDLGKAEAERVYAKNVLEIEREKGGYH